MKSVNSEFDFLTQKIKNSQLILFAVDTALASMSLEFAMGVNNDRVKILFNKIVVFNFLKKSNDDSEMHVAEARLKVVHDDTNDLFESLEMRSVRLREILSDFTARPVYYLCLEGDVNIEVVAASCVWML